MPDLLLGFYILFFATGFMGWAAMFVLGLRVRSAILKPLLWFQSIYMLGMGLVVIYLYLHSRPEGLAPTIALGIGLAAATVNAAVYVCAFVILDRLAAASDGAEAKHPQRRLSPRIGQGLALAVVAKSFLNMAVAAAAAGGAAWALALRGGAWSLSGYVLSGLAIAAFGVSARGPAPASEPPIMRSLLKAYGLCALGFAPLGLLEYLVESSGLSWLPGLSTDHLFFLAWNLVSMGAAIRLLKPDEAGIPALDAVPAERITALGLSGRETEMAVLIARGLANKEIAAELGISPATVRTHIYNLYQKAGARSRVELINKLRA